MGGQGTCALQPGSAACLPAAADLLPSLPFSRGQRSGRLRAGLRGSLLSPKPTCPGGSPTLRCGEHPGQAAPAWGYPAGGWRGEGAALEGLRLFRPKSPNRRQGQPRS